MDPASTVVALQPGDVVAGVYHVEALLGRGGAAAVYRVHDARSGQRFALKQLLPPDDERRALITTQFEREFYTLSQLAHPRIIEVHDYGLERGFAYYTMELLDGEDLHERRRRPWMEACALLRDVASSLAIIHSRGLVHRDLSPRNVRCARDQRAKLIDFGAMVPMGVSRRLVGTPPFVAPEALQLQPLDGRADLFGLGALAYFMLTGRNAYPAHGFHQLRDLWRTPIPSPREYDAAMPEALAELVLQLLQLERTERPRSAAEVMERLCGIAGLQLEELQTVGRAYLVMPTLVGRDAQLREVRGALLSAMQGARGSAVLIEGEPGCGRSRFLDACVLDAKLTGAVVLRGDVGDGGAEPYALARVLCTQLLQAMPALAEQNAQPRLSVLAHVLPELAPHAAQRDTAPQRRNLQAALRDWVLALARERHIVIAVDDVAAIDEPSAAWLGALAHGARRRKLNLLLTARWQQEPRSGVIGLLHEVARPIRLEALSLEQTEALLRSLFGDADRLVPLAQRVHALAHGSPRAIMGLCEHLVARGFLRYEAGSWSLPLDLDATDLPASDHEIILQRIDGLGADARELLDAVSLADPAMLSLPDYPQLLSHRDSSRTFRALDELVAAGILVAEAERYRVTRPDALDAARGSLALERCRQLHARIAALLRTRRGAERPLAMHLLLGGQEREAIDRLLAYDTRVYDPRICDVLALAVEAAERLKLPVRAQVGLRTLLASEAGYVGRLELFERYAGAMTERLERDSGLLDCFELGAELDPEARRDAAFARAQQRYDQTPETERAFPPDKCVSELLLLYGAYTSMGAITQSMEYLERPRSLSPWLGLGPAIDLMQATIEIQRANQIGRSDLAQTLGEALLARIDGLPKAVRNDVMVGEMRVPQLYAMGLRSAVAGQDSTEASVAELEQEPGLRSNAWRIRMVYQLALGDPERAQDCRRRAELLDLQDGGQSYPGSTLRSELLIHIATEDVVGVKRAIERIEQLARSYPGWRPTLAMARSHYRRLQGDPGGALEVLQPVIDSAPPGRHPDWGPIGDARLMALRDGGRASEAAALGLELIETGERHELHPDVRRLKRVLAEVLAAAGEVQQAREFADACVEQRERAQYHGVLLALAYETRAKVAIAMRDAPALQHWAERCATAFSTAHNPGASARYERLMREAATAGLLLKPAVAAHTLEAPMEDVARTVYSRMLTCISPAERSERGLALLLEASGARSGHLFGLRSGQLRWLCSADQNEPPPRLAQTLEQFLRQRLEHEAEAPLPAGFAPSPLDSYVDDWGRELKPLLLRGTHNGEAIFAGVAALEFDDDEPPAVRRAMLEAVIDALIANDIVDPITCVA